MSAITILPESQLSEPNLDSPSAVQIELPNALQALGTCFIWLKGSATILTKSCNMFEWRMES
jgi:hypothetical protein